MIVDVIIPALNEEKSIALVIQDIPSYLVRNIYVCDNGSTDNTAANAKSAGAIVVHEAKKGYGAACLKGISTISNTNAPPDILVFIDGDYSDYPQELESLIKPIIDSNKDLVIGSRVQGLADKGSLTQVQKFGNALSTKLISLLFNEHFTDLGPFRAIRWESLIKLNMVDQNYGWTVEMQVKAAKLNMDCCEVPVNYKNRIGKSKVSGTIKGSILAGYKILSTIFKHYNMFIK